MRHSETRKLRSPSRPLTPGTATRSPSKPLSCVSVTATAPSAARDARSTATAANAGSVLGIIRDPTADSSAADGEQGPGVAVPALERRGGGGVERSERAEVTGRGGRIRRKPSAAACGGARRWVLECGPDAGTVGG